MPAYYNRSIDLAQWLALRPFIREAGGRSVLDVGCGIGRWSYRFARRGARVVGIDPSREMVAQARRRSLVETLEPRPRFLVGDVVQLPIQAAFDRIVVVTVLQHIVDDAAVACALENLRRLLSRDGRLLLLEVAPSAPTERCAGTWFLPRSFGRYRQLCQESGLKVVAVRGVDPAAPRQWLLPHYRAWPRALAETALFSATALTAPLDAVLGRSLPGLSWHKLMVLSHDR
jgi:ubiquinone/menaquinone biosynthesis C-methylase UbiE